MDADRAGSYRTVAIKVLHRLLLLLALLPLLIPVAHAHEMSMAEMEVRETSPGEFIWQWAAVNDKRPQTSDLVPRWPEPCTAIDNQLHCGTQGLKGRFSIDGVGKRYSAALVKIFWLDGQSRVYTLTGGQPSAQLYGTADDRRSMLEVARAYVPLGVEHILSGYDHLLFVFGLLFMVGFTRQLIWTITAFTLAHSLTLALSALGLLTLRPPPVEASIALSIMLVAGEALHTRPTVSRRFPAVVAFVFGLVHGLGFAGALREIGLPEAHLPVALLTFNVGVEIGQLFVVAAAFGVYTLGRRLPAFERARVPALYLIGSLAAYWSIGRILAVLGA